MASQEEVAAAVGDDDGSGDEGEKGDQNQDEDSDCSSDFGLGGTTKKAAPSKRPKDKEKEKKSPRPDKSKSGESKQAADNKAVEKAKLSLEQSTKLLGAVAPINAASIWKGAFKDADISARLKKLSQAGSGLSQQASTIEVLEVKSEMEGLANRIEKKVNEISALQEVLGQVRSAKQLVPLLKDEEVKNKLGEICFAMDAETLSAVLLNMATKLSEAGLLLISFVTGDGFCFMFMSQTYDVRNPGSEWHNRHLRGFGQ